MSKLSDRPAITLEQLRDLHAAMQAGQKDGYHDEAEWSKLLGVYQDLEHARLVLEGMVAAKPKGSRRRLNWVLVEVDHAAETARAALQAAMGV